MPSLARMRILNCAMTEDPEQQSNRLLEPAERISAVPGPHHGAYVTCSFSVAGAGKTEIRTMLLEALGCNLAWGIIDGVFYLMGCFSKRGRNLVLMREVQKGSAVQGTHILASTMPRMLVPLLPEGALELMRQKITAMPPAPAGVRLHKRRLDRRRQHRSTDIPLHSSRGRSVPVFQRSLPAQACPADIQLHRHRDDVPGRLFLRRPLWRASMANGNLRGGFWRGHGGSRHSAWRVRAR